MDTKVIQIDEPKDASGIRTAAEYIRAGELVAFPTETVYGLGGNGLNPTAAGKIYSAKGRPSDNPLIIHICDIADLAHYAKHVPEQAYALAEAFWPGPLTMILPKADEVPHATTGGLDTVAIRMPDHPVALELIRQSGCPIAAPSANTSGRPSPTTANHVYEDLQGKIPVILDGGEVGIGIESTIIDLSGGMPMILRPGYINREMLEAVIGPVVMDPGLMEVSATVRPKAPGMKYRHYAPEANLIIVAGSRMVPKINELVATAKAEGKRVGIICTTENESSYRGGTTLCVGSRENEREIARHLFGVLRECDRLGVDVIYAEELNTPLLGWAVMNRLGKAAAHQVITAE